MTWGGHQGSIVYSQLQQSNQEFLEKIYLPLGTYLLLITAAWTENVSEFEEPQLGTY